MVNEPDIFRKKVVKPWGFEIIYTPDGAGFTGKILFIKAGSRLSLQYHDRKEESLCLISGRALMWLEDDSGEVVKLEMEPRFGYHVRVNRRHRIEAMEDSLIIESSDPEHGNTFRIEDDYARGIETEEVRSEPDRGWKAAAVHKN